MNEAAELTQQAAGHLDNRADNSKMLRQNGIIFKKALGCCMQKCTTDLGIWLFRVHPCYCRWLIFILICMKIKGILALYKMSCVVWIS
jgi:hypothetical protein